jgi:hypothetical protein
MKQVLLSLCLLALVGCKATGVDNHPRMDRAGEEVDLARLEALKAQAAQVESVKDMTASTNATQQTLTGLGLQISKLAESFKVADTLARFENTIKTELAATVNAVSHIEVKNDVNAKAFSDLNARLDKMEISFKSSVDVDGVAALKSDIQKMSQTVSAGRDSHVQTIQFSREMRDTLIQSFENQLDTTKAFCALIVSLMGILQITDRLRAKNDHKEFMKALSLLSKGENKNE